MVTTNLWLRPPLSASPGPAPSSPRSPGVVLNDVHSKLNRTLVDRVARPNTLGELQQAVRAGAATGRGISIGGGLHAMGGQQFCTGSLHIDTRALNRILSFDPERGLIHVEAGIDWPTLINGYLDLQQRDGRTPAWGIAQKQTGADRLCIGGSLAANAHGRGLTMPPLIADVESIDLIDSRGDLLRCSRAERPDLFRTTIGGYGLTGVIYAATLRLAPRRILRREVELLDIEDLIPALDRRIADGCLYGDFQFAIDPASREFLRRGVMSCYRPVTGPAAVPPGQRNLSPADWMDLLRLAHRDKSRAFSLYTDHYRATHGQLYWSDTHQLSTYIDDYHSAIDCATCAWERATEVISELYVPPEQLTTFMTHARGILNTARADVIYGTVRLIQPDHETVLAWARRRSACIVLNLHTPHTAEGVERTAEAFRALIDAAIALGGTYYLTYHRFATARQLAAGHPRFGEFAGLKRRFDPRNVFRSDWFADCSRKLGLL